MHLIADMLYVIAALVYLPYAVFEAVARGKNRTGWAHRFGRVPRRDPSRRRIWIHAVSLGEVNATPRMVEALTAALPDWDIVVSTTTDTGFARATQLYGADRVFRYPLDFSPCVSTALDRVRPSMIVLVELEVWYNLIRESNRRKIPVVVVNGRLSDRSARRFSRFRVLIEPMFRRLAWVGAQDEQIAERFIRLGSAASRITVTSSMKWDTATVADAVEGTKELATDLSLDPAVPLWVCGSTGPGEESLLLEVYTQLRRRGLTVRMVIAPRKPERFDDVASLIRESGHPLQRRSAPDLKAPPDAIILGDTMGELRKFYSLATIAFIGRSLVPMGGSDPIEAAALGCPLVSGPHMQNFRAPVEALRRADALRVADDPAQLTDILIDWLRDPAHTRAVGMRGQEVVRAGQGATARTVDGIVRIASMRSADDGRV